MRGLTQKIVASLCALCAMLYWGCGNKNAGHNKQPFLILLHDSGYVTKSDLLPFLLASGLTDSIKDYWKERFPNPGDTIGKYYPSNTAGNTILLAKMICKRDSFEHLIVMEITREGLLLQQAEYWSGDEWCDEDAIRSFRKIGRYFMITGCGHGSGYFSQYRHIFDHITPEDSSVKIYFSIYRSYAIPQIVSAGMSVRETSIMMHYTIEHGNDEQDTTRWEIAREGDMLFSQSNNNWVASDSSLLNDMDME